MRAALILVFVCLVGVGPRAEGVGICRTVPATLWEWVANFVRGRAPQPALGPKVTPPRGDLAPGERPMKPDSDFHEVVEIRPDPAFPEHFVYVVSPKPGADRAKGGLENSRTFEAVVRRYPKFAESLGIRVVEKDGRVQLIYPTIEGLNARAGAGEAKFWRDGGASDTDHVQMARALAERGEFAISEGAPIEKTNDKAARNYHFHDMFVHTLGFAALSPAVIGMTRARLKALLGIYDLPALAGNSAARKAIEHLIIEEISQLDSSSNLLQSELAVLGPKPTTGPDNDAFNVLLKLAPLVRGRTHVQMRVADALANTRLSRAQQRAIEAALREMPVIERVNAETEANALVARFRAMLR